MRKSDKFLQFPLCALALDLDKDELLNKIISYGLLEAGIKHLKSLSKDERVEECESFDLAMSKHDSFELAAHLGARICNINLGYVPATIKRHSELESFRNRWEERNGADPIGRMSKNICFDVRDQNTQLSLREFRVLAGIYSCLGVSPYRAVNARMIRVRAVGCKSEAVEKLERTQGTALPPLLSEKQVRGTVERLHETKWFARVTPQRHGRVTYYSNRLSEADLVEKIFKKRTYSASHAAARQRTTHQLSARINAAKNNSQMGDAPAT